jgi:hypothetical protein
LIQTETASSSLLTSELTTLTLETRVHPGKLTDLFSKISLSRTLRNFALRALLSTMATIAASTTKTSRSIAQTGATTTRKVISLHSLTTTKMEFSVVVSSQALWEVETSMVTSYCQPMSSSPCWDKTKTSSVRTSRKLSTKSSAKWPNSAFQPSRSTFFTSKTEQLYKLIRKRSVTEGNE